MLEVQSNSSLLGFKLQEFGVEVVEVMIGVFLRWLFGQRWRDKGILDALKDPPNKDNTAYTKCTTANPEAQQRILKNLRL